MNCRTRIICSRSILSRGLASHVGKKNHYDSLEVGPKATQSEIKSAYFKLTMQYHPDKNSSETAKIKFHDISEAYEVLGNYQKRRQYDRGMHVRTERTIRKSEGFNHHDIKKEASRVRTALHRHSSETPGGSKMYDFDRWTTEHYGNTFRKAQSAKEDAMKQKMDKIELLTYKASPQDGFLLVVLICLFTGMMGFITRNNDFDDPAIGRNHTEEPMKDGT
ncbi:dnaJ homolog subfamily C member 30, mitochondrial-like [Diachasmimorpha longicaudata]|uniref:dnaJ homolog subfamily C member 30, mitochondrial-like n=1 Tax=Diachasmimorpha longicaudata TaxID=58733 RepID=UPI0030B8F8D0